MNGNEQGQENGQGQGQKSEYSCPVCASGVKFTTDPITKKLKAIKCKSNVYNQAAKRNTGCDFIVYSKQKLLDPKLLLKDDLKKLIIGETLRMSDMNVFIDAKNPTVTKNPKTKEDIRYYLKIQRDDDIEEEVI